MEICTLVQMFRIQKEINLFFFMKLSAHLITYLGNGHSAERLGWKPDVEGLLRSVMFGSAFRGAMSATTTKPNVGDYEPHMLKRGPYLTPHNCVLGLTSAKLLTLGI
jgi:hypothetical protein